jgi:hypothetical protein
VYEDVRWAPRLADVPGVTFTGSPGVDRTKLKNHALRPNIGEYGLSWGDEDGDDWSSESPAASHRGERDLKVPALIKRTWESLELPGTAEDWHFALLEAVGQLSPGRRSDPAYLTVCEQFCRIDIDLVRARPEPFMRGETAADGFLSMATFRTLVKILRAVDDLEEALVYAKLGVEFGQGTEEDVEQIEAALGAGV